MCLLTPKSSSITQCHDEIAKSQWMDIEEFAKIEHKVETQGRVAKLALKIIQLHQKGEAIEDICWSWDIVHTNLKTV
jgi:hypothetical protein